MDAVGLPPIIFVILLIQKGVNSVVIQNIYSNGCSNEEMKLKCPDNHKIAIKRLFFGVKNDRNCVENGRRHSADCCQSTHHDCRVTDDRKYPRLNSGCSGYPSCTTDSLSIDTGGECPNPDWTSTDYMTVIHDCVPENDIAEFCMNHEKRGKYLYLSNQRYPSPIQGGYHHCPCLIKTGSSSGLNIHAIDISITQSDYGPKSCAQEVKIHDSYGMNKIITCGHEGLYGFRPIYKRRTENVTIILDSTSPESRGYVWMQIKAESPDDFVMIYCGDALKALYAQNKKTPESGDSVQLDNPDKDNTQPGTGKGRAKTPEIVQDNVTVIIVICCAVGVVLVISVAAIVIHCRRIRVRKQRQPRNTDTFPSPLPKSKSLPMDALSYCKYDYDEDHYCTIRRSPMKVSKFTEVDTSADRKLREAFLQGVSNGSTNKINTQSPLIKDSDKNVEYKTICKIPPVQSEVAEIKVQTLPHKAKPKSKTVTFSPVAMVSPLNSGSEESVKENNEELKKLTGTFPVHKWQNGQGNGYLPQTDKIKPTVIVTGPQEEGSMSTFHSDNRNEDDSWKSFTTYDDGMYDNIQYLLKQNSENASSDFFSHVLMTKFDEHDAKKTESLSSQVITMETFVLKNRRTTLERVEKFISPTYFTDVNLRGKLYKKTAPLKRIGHYAALDRITFEAAVGGAYTDVSIGQKFGPTWSTHWFFVEVDISRDWAGEEVRLVWNSDSEAMVWLDGQPVQGLSGENKRHDYILSYKQPEDNLSYKLYIEMACNGLFGAGNGVFLNEPDNNRMFTLSQAEVAVFNRSAYTLIMDLQVLYGMAKHLPEDTTERGYQALYTANHIINTCDVNDSSTFLRCHQIADKFFKQRNGDSQHSIHAMGHAHIDTAWLWPYAETIRKCARSWSCTLRLMERYPNFTFTCSQAQQFEWTKQHYPSLYEEIKKYVEKGQFIPVGGAWVEMDGNVPSGESFMRQFLYGQRYFEKEFGKKCSEFWLPDTFGYSGQLPQIMQLFGINRFLTQKMSWNLVNKFPHHTFWWEGIDGSQVLCHFPPGDNYCMKGEAEELLYTLKNFRDKGRSGKSVYLFGYGDGGHGPSEEMLERLTRMEDVDGLPKVKFSTPDKFFSSVERDDHNLCRWYGELYLELHNGTYTSQAKAKYCNRKCEFLLHNVEFAATLALMLSLASQKTYKYPDAELLRLWKLLLLNQFHDVLPGSSIGLVYKDSQEHYKDIETSGGKLLEASVRSFLKCDGTGSATVVVNTHSWERTEVITLPRAETSHCTTTEMQTTEGTVQIDSCGRTLAIVTIPGCGYSFCQPMKYQFPAVTNRQDDIIILENEHIQAFFDNCGRLLELHLQGNSRNGISLDKPANQFVIYDDIPLFWDAWDIMDYHLETRKPIESVIQHSTILDDGPLRVSLEVSLKISDRSYLKQVISLDAGCPYLKFKTEVNWHENRKLLKVEFPTSVYNKQVTYEIQCGHLQRPTHTNTSWDWAKFEVCGHKWADLSEYGFGVAMLNDSKYGYSARDNVMWLSLLKASKAPDAKADMGTHHFTYGIMPHTGNLQDSGVIQQAYNLNNPLVVESITKSSNIPDSCQYFTVDVQQVILETVKKSEDYDNGVVLHLYEAYGSHSPVRLTSHIPFKKAYRCNGLEEPVEDEVFKSMTVLFSSSSDHSRFCVLCYNSKTCS
ncbi:hypothetical protein ScPMuIL_012297 [Solemya velum]